jgi:hypothetical protein
MIFEAVIQRAIEQIHFFLVILRCGRVLGQHGIGGISVMQDELTAIVFQRYVQDIRHR